jgi:D-3-phosphoglycerate dehydrogenase
MKIAVLDDYAQAFEGMGFAQALRGHELRIFNDTEKNPDRLAERLRDVEALLLTQQRSPLPGALVRRLPALRLVSQTGRNTSHIDLAACTACGVAVCAGGTGGPHPTAELTWGLIIGALRRIPQEAARLRGGLWQGSVGIGLAGKTLGVYSFGRIGSVVAQIGRAFGMRVLCWGRESSLARAREAGFEAASDRAAFFASADVLSLHIAMNTQTRGIVTAADLARMKPTALLVNTSRAPIIEAGALEQALAAGRPGLAAVDVFEDEPVLGAAHPLIGMDNALCTPHLGYVEREALQAMFGTAVEQILAFAAGKPINLINPQVLGGT